MEKERPLILVTNDDGIAAPGIRTLIKVMNTLGEVWVIAPDKPQSGMGHAITIDSTLFCYKVKIDEGVQRDYNCSGTPVDCVKLAIDKILPRVPDLCVSGINHGSNSSINILYSGTMSAAVEAGLEGIAAIGFSYLDYGWNANFTPCEPYVRSIAQKVLDEGLPQGTVLNVNIPFKNEIKGVRICRQAQAAWCEEYDKRQDPRGRNYYWLTGRFICKDDGEDTDEWALEHDYISVVPVQFDLTAHHTIDELKKWNL